ncbi:MAG: PAS domain S-box protein, partial [Gammaproteobacteria bacterium]|nr:PAS domain S-box protein [Gammaproteobacteria bacterium]
MPSAPFYARFLPRSDAWGLLRPDARRVINVSLVVLSLLVVLLAAPTGWRSWRQYEQARHVAEVDAVTNDFIAAAGLLELELTYGSALLGGEARDPDRLLRLHRVRRQGDLLWRRAMARTRAIAARSPMAVDLLARHASAQQSFLALLAARRQLEACLRAEPCGLAEDAWQRSVDRVVQDSSAAREAVYFSVDAPQRPARLYAAVQRSVWTLTEYTRRESGLMAFYLSGDQALTDAARAELASESAVAREAQRSLRVFTRLHRLDERTRFAILAADRSLTERFTPLLSGVLDGRLRPDGRAWLARTAPTVTALDRLSATVEDAVAALAADAMRESRNDMLLNGAFMVLALALAGLSASKVRQTAKALYHQKELAEVTIRSIGDAVITTDERGRVEYINPAAEQMTGWSSREAHGLPLERVFEVVNGVTLERQVNPIEVCLRENRVVSLEDDTVLLHRDGSR